jgi:hypothetical protein
MRSALLGLTTAEFPMTRVFQTNPVDTEWRNVSERSPCPICGASEACRTHPDGHFACCAQKPSEWPMTNGAWLHRIALSSASEVRAAGPRHEEHGSRTNSVFGALP